MDSIWAAVQGQLVELGLLALGSLITAYAVPWLRQAHMAAFADRVEQLLKNAAAAGINATPGIVQGEPVPHEKISDVVNNAYEYAMKQAPELTRALGKDIVDKIKARLPII